MGDHGRDMLAEEFVPTRGDVLAHAFAGKPGDGLNAALEMRVRDGADVGPFAPIVARVSGPADIVGDAASGLPAGEALAEAVVARLRRSGVYVGWGEPVVVADAAELIVRCRNRGASSVELIRADPSLLPHLQIGSWPRLGWRFSLGRRATYRLPGALLAVAASRGPHALELALEAAFWSGVRSAATDREFLRLTRSYVVLSYHRIGGEPVDERLDVPASSFEQQTHLLRLLRFHALSPTELIGVHDEDAVLPRRGYVLTADDGFEDTVRALSAAAAHRPQLFVPTALLGGNVPWAGEARLASWEEVEQAAANGVLVGSHTRSHPVLPDLSPAALELELTKSLADLGDRLTKPARLLAYPHGRHDLATRRAAAAAGYRAAYTTAPGRNGAGSDPFQLKRIGVKQWDNRLTFLWKVTTGEHVPVRWDRWRRWLFRRGFTARTTWRRDRG
jgi:peptidoglycan/xylan/chitin deacetylase (PgdA/CDA1 family)